MAAGLRKLLPNRRADAGEAWGDEGEITWGRRDASSTGVALESCRSKRAQKMPRVLFPFGQTCSGKMVAWKRCIAGLAVQERKLFRAQK